MYRILDLQKPPIGLLQRIIRPLVRFITLGACTTRFRPHTSKDQAIMRPWCWLYVCQQLREGPHAGQHFS